MEEKKNGAKEEIYLAPAEATSEDLQVETAETEAVQKADIPVKPEKKPKPRVRVGEILELREENRKVFRMSDGTEQAVFFPEAVHVFNEETQAYDEMDATLSEDADKKHYVGGRGRFTARFSLEEDNDELFSIEQGIHRVTVYAKKNKKQKNKGIKPTIRKNDAGAPNKKDVLTFKGVEAGSDYEYSLIGNGVKENIVVNERSDAYRYPFVLHCEGVTAQLDEENKRVAFVNNETGEEVFFIPVPFMTDANGVNSTAVSYVLETDSNTDPVLTITADSNWLNAEQRAFPVVIDPQIRLSNSSEMSTYSWSNGNMSNASQHAVGAVPKTCQPDTSNGRTGKSMATAIELPFDKHLCDSIDTSGGAVWYKFTANVEAAHYNDGIGNYIIFTKSALNTVGTLYDADGNIISSKVGHNGGNFYMIAELGYGGTYYLRVNTHDGSTGSYRLILTYDIAYGTNAPYLDYYTMDRMYMAFQMPTLPRNPRIKKAEITFFQEEGVVEYRPFFKLGLYQVTGDISIGQCTPSYDYNLLDYAEVQSSDTEGAVSYTFDVTALVDKINKGESNYQKLVLQMITEVKDYDNYVRLYGSDYGGSYAPQFSITYEPTYGVNTSYRTHTHSLGRFGQGSIDLQCGNLMFDSEDFAWAGNRMPVTIRHLYNSALSSYKYTTDSSIKLNTADFGAMNLGYGFKLNVMQSMVSTNFIHEGETTSGYVYMGENSEEIYFKESNQHVSSDNDGQNYNLYEAVDDSEMLYDPVKRTLTQGEDTYLFDNLGRLVQITDDCGNHLDITYTSGRITTVTDGAGRNFVFAYDDIGYLTSITAPDNTSILYTYSDRLLSTITYPDGQKAQLTYSGDMPANVILLDVDGNNMYKVVYSYNRNRVFTVSEYGVRNGSFVLGNESYYYYSAASGRTNVESYERMEGDDGECYPDYIVTTYTFDDDGNIVGEYAYSADTGYTGVDGNTSGILPYAGDGGMRTVNNSYNLLTGHNFESLNGWSEMPSNYSNLDISIYENEASAKFGKSMLQMQSHASICTENGIYQTTNSLRIGQYTFSAYLRVVSAFSGTAAPGAYIRVTATDGTVLAESEHIRQSDSEYIRLCVPFKLTATQSVQVQILLDGTGTVYVDGAQLEKNPYANPYNMLENGSFEQDTGWTRSDYTYYTNSAYFNMSRSLLVRGDIEAESYAFQSVAVRSERPIRETFTLSGWAKGYGLPNHGHEGTNTPIFRLRAVVNYNDSVENEDNSESFTADFSPGAEEWQYASVQFAKSKYRTVRDITVYCEYNYNYGTVYFDDIQLVRDSLELNLSADDFVVESAEESCGVVEIGTYADTAPTFEEAKDAFGNTLTETTFTDGEFGTIYRSFAYNTDPDGSGNPGNDLVMETDARGYTTAYTVNEDTSRNEEVTDRCGNKTAYEYDASGRTTKVTSKTADGTELAHVSYAYDVFDNLTEIVRGDGMKYALAYDAYHKLASIGVDGEENKLVQYTYIPENGRLRGITYANGDRMALTYNSAGHLTGEKWFDQNATMTAHYKYVYDGQGNIVRSIDMLAKKEYTYSYEEGKLTRAAECRITIGDNEMITKKVLVNTIFYVYDNEDTLIRKRIVPAEGEERVIYYETTDDSTVVKFEAGGKTVTSHSKTDNFGRKVFDELQLGTGFVSRQFSYHAGDVTEEHKENAMLRSSPTTQLVSQIVLSDGRTLSYEYDAEERITKVTDSIEGVTEYTYDALGQLLTETVNGEVVNEMVYDNYGNILQKNGIRYTYSEGWNDRLAFYDGVQITYDAQGNPVNYLGHTLIWEKGRQLKSFDGISYTYNANGIRTSKTVDGVPHNYLLDGVNILKETWNDNTLETLFDNEDSVCGIVYNGIPYYFLKNLQGDIIAITDQNGEVVARYTYDAWGKCDISVNSTNATIAEINPYRYRSYYFDTETGLYYLQSRYYDPVVGRFINADDIAYVDFDGSMASKNIFTYCNNSPVKYYDPDGRLGIFVVVGGVKVSIEVVALIAACIVALIPVIVQVLRDLVKIIYSTVEALASLIAELAAIVKKAFAARQQRTMARHHIIAKSAWRAAPARKIWVNRMGMSINDSRNIAVINQTLHYYVHTTAYYAAVNTLVTLGYKKGKSTVLKTVKLIQSILVALSNRYF